MATTKITNPELFDLGSLNTALKLPSGTTAERPTSPSTGEWRYNTTTNLVEFWDGGAWRDLQSENIPPIPSENFNTVIYDGNGGTNNITGVGFQPDLVWIKQRDTAIENHNWYDSTRGVRNYIVSNSTAANVFGSAQRLNAFGADGFTVGNDNEINDSGSKYVAWCWKANGGTTSSNTDGTQTSTVQVNSKAGFSIVQWTSSAAGASETVGHGLGATPAMIILKRTDAVEDWYIWHKDLGAGSSALNQFLRFTTASQATATNLFNTVNSTVFNPSYTNGVPNTNIAYCFAEKAEYSKFGSYIGNGSTNGPMVVTGFEPAYIMIKNSTSTYEWTVYDNKRSTSNPRDNVLYPNNTGTENSGETGDIDFLSNGFQLKSPTGTINQNGGTIIYAAFASDASAAPVLADSFANKLYTGNGGTQSITGLGFSPSFAWIKKRNGSEDHAWFDVVRGVQRQISSNLTAAGYTTTNAISSFDADGWTTGNNGATNASGETYVAWNWKANSVPTINTDGTIQSVVSANQAAGFSIVSYTGTGANASVGHGLASAPELLLIKGLVTTNDWAALSVHGSDGEFLQLNSSAAESGAGSIFGSPFTRPTSTVFSIGNTGETGTNNSSYIAYCFTSIAGFSKMGTYTGSGSDGNVVATGFKPSWVMIKRSNSTGGWLIFDSARSPSNPVNDRLEANNNQAEQTNSGDKFLDFNATDFEANGSDSELNASGGTYIYMAFKENITQYPISSGYMGYLVVAGGAGGGYAQYGNGGGGGAGGLRTTYGTLSGGGASAESDLTLTTGTYTITVGAGGGSSVAGSASTITGSASISTVGGGRAGYRNGPRVEAASGGSGGGGFADGVSPDTIRPGGAGTTGEGFAGADSQNATNIIYAGGGGGAAAAAVEVNGGDALSVSITGSNVYYAGGGGTAGKFNNGENYANPTGTVTGGAGTSQGNNSNGQAAQANTGSGGGASHSSTGSSNNGGSGGSGIVVLRLNTSDYSGTTTGSPTVTTKGSETILTYTGSGTYVHS